MGFHWLDELVDPGRCSPVQGLSEGPTSSGKFGLSGFFPCLSPLRTLVRIPPRTKALHVDWVFSLYHIAWVFTDWMSWLTQEGAVLSRDCQKALHPQVSLGSVVSFPTFHFGSNPIFHFYPVYLSISFTCFFFTITMRIYSFNAWKFKKVWIINKEKINFK